MTEYGFHAHNVAGSLSFGKLFVLWHISVFPSQLFQTTKNGSQTAKLFVFKPKAHEERNLLRDPRRCTADMEEHQSVHEQKA